ncbi:MAG: deoxyuridine 5'-triphosphate nucleotidohydrolase [Amphiamblys sp. WSBS2006]|nr:MAG: deoxyuridine 5'-triphosphate nucleotidohydrolase [Amphiamblys sp. WSBS2006]
MFLNELACALVFAIPSFLIVLRRSPGMGCEEFCVKLLNPDAQVPKRGSAFSAGYDLCASSDSVVPARGKGHVKTGLSVSIPNGYYARIAPRSGLAAKSSIDVGAGVVDSDYRGEVVVILFNHGEEDFAVKKGMRCAQLIITKILTPEIKVVEEHGEKTGRDAGGFGSTGMY